MDYQAALHFLQRAQAENHKLSLANVSNLVAGLKLESEALPFFFIQVGGTNGKGSTSHMLAAILCRAGYRVGLFTSPHLSEVRERIAVDGKIIGKRDFSRAVALARDHAEAQMAAGLAEAMPTYFETIMLAALCHFRRRRVQIAVMEVGLGGRLDATTALPAGLKLITNVSLDHQHILGRSIGAIAAEKGAMARPGIPLLIGCRKSARARAVLARCAAQAGAPLYQAFGPGTGLRVSPDGQETQAVYYSGQKRYEYSLRLSGRHQAENAALAIRAVELLQDRGLKIPEQAIRRGLARLRVPARLEVFPGRPEVIIDGAHNRASTEALAAWLKERKGPAPTLVFGVLADKEYRIMASLLAPLVRRVVLTEPASDRKLVASRLQPFFGGCDIMVAADPRVALETARKFAEPVLVCGSLYLAGALRPICARGVK